MNNWYIKAPPDVIDKIPTYNVNDLESYINNATVDLFGKKVKIEDIENNIGLKGFLVINYFLGK